MNAKSIELQSIRQHCKTLRMPSVATQFQKIAEQAQRDEHSYVRYLDVLLSAEVEEREHRAVQRRLKEAQLPRAKTLEEFDFSQSPKVSARRIRELAEGDYIDHARPVLFLGDAGTGKTHLATALCVAACQQRRRVRFTTASRLVNELVEARGGARTLASDPSLRPLRVVVHRRARLRPTRRCRRRASVPSGFRNDAKGRRS